MSRVTLASFLILAELLAAAPVAVASFTDVPDTHPFLQEIRLLQDRDIVRGNPDGAYHPESSINRAELLTILYRATGRVPNAPAQACFKDAVQGSWYEAVVCDAAARGFVAGYPDKTFKPEKEVNRVEALKMIHTVFGFASPLETPAALKSLYIDVDASAWFGPYVTSAFVRGVIPIAGQGGPLFEPGRALTRGEAAAYISNALGLDPSASSSSESSAVFEGASGASSATAPSSLQGGPSPQSQDVTFPFNDAGAFAAKEKHVYRFSLSTPVIALVQATVDPQGGKSGLTCRLYKLAEETSFAIEYYTGQIIGDTCRVRVAVGEGNYQLELQPRAAGALFTVDVHSTEGDGNDGFREAATLPFGKSISNEIEGNDIADWYMFTLIRGQTMTINIQEGNGVTCSIYPMEDVDLYGFNSPVCDASYDYPSGTYYIGVQKKDGRTSSESFAIRVQ